MQQVWIGAAYLAALAGAKDFGSKYFQRFDRGIQTLRARIQRDPSALLPGWERELQEYCHPLAKLHSTLEERLDFLEEYLGLPSGLLRIIALPSWCLLCLMIDVSGWGVLL